MAAVMRETLFSQERVPAMFRLSEFYYGAKMKTDKREKQQICWFPGVAEAGPHGRAIQAIGH